MSYGNYPPPPPPPPPDWGRDAGRGFLGGFSGCLGVGLAVLLVIIVGLFLAVACAHSIHFTH